MTDNTGDSTPGGERGRERQPDPTPPGVDETPTEHLPAAETPAERPAAPGPAKGPAEGAEDATPTDAEHGHPAPPPPTTPVAPVAAAVPTRSPGRWRRTARSRPLQLIAVGLVGAVLGGSAVAAVGALTHHGRDHHGTSGYYERYERGWRGGPPGDGPHGDRPGWNMPERGGPGGDRPNR
jgi:hypothetical protein